jgi:hypothetical protein
VFFFKISCIDGRRAISASSLALPLLPAGGSRVVVSGAWLF